MTSGPPELPGLSAASVWITSSMRRAGARTQRAPERRNHASGDGRFKAERIADRHHELAALELLNHPMWRSADRAPSLHAQQRQIGVRIVMPSRRASMTRPSASCTRTSLAPSTTCELVSTRPSGEMITPDPDAPGASPARCGPQRARTAGPTTSATVVTALNRRRGFRYRRRTEPLPRRRPRHRTTKQNRALAFGVLWNVP